MESTPFVSAAAAEGPAPPIVDDADFGEALQPAGAEASESPPAARPRRGFGREKSR